MKPVSVIMAYWKREDALRVTLASFERWYTGDVEVVVAVDGCDPPQLREYPFPVRLVELPRKDHPMNPCVPFNAAARAASHPILAITNPETSHPQQVLYAMRDVLADAPTRYVVAACLDTSNVWYQHSRHRNKCYHWMTMLHAELYWAVGGFSEEYRDGMGYDDDDFLMKLQRHGVELVCRDDLVVIHDGATSCCVWGGDGERRNRDLFLSKQRTRR